MRNTGNLLKWTQNSNNKSAKGGGKSINFVQHFQNIFITTTVFFQENRNWIHPPEALQKGHIAYIVKVLIVC